MSQSVKASPAAQKDASSLYLESLTHAEKLVEAQPTEEDKSAWRKWARELINYEVKTLTPREKRAPRLAKYADGAGERFLAVMKAIEATEARLKNGDGGPSSSGESEPEESSTTRRSARRLATAGVVPGQATASEANENSKASASVSALNLTDAQRTINYEVPCSRCARAGIACAGKEGRACFTCRAHRQGCDLSSRAIRDRARAEGSDKETEEQDSASAAPATRRASSKGKDKKETLKDGDKVATDSEGVSEVHAGRPKRAATLINNWRIGSPKTVAQLRTGSSSSTQRKRRATDADLSVASSIPPGPSPLKKARASFRREEERASHEADFDREEVRDALLVCEAAFRQLRKALQL